MITEKRLLAVAEQSITADGTDKGQITVADTKALKVGQNVILDSNTLDPSIFQIKRVESSTVLFLGDPSKPIQHRSDLTAYTVASNTTIAAPEQKRPSIPQQEIERLTYEEEPTIARRVVQVDQYGDKYTLDNPMPVQLSDGNIDIGTVNAELEVQLSHQDNVPDAGDVADSVQIGDGTEILAVNPDGSINVKLSLAAPGDYLNIFDTASSVASAATATISTYTVPVGKTAFLIRTEYSGSNMAIYQVDINATIEARKRLYFGGQFSGTFEFDSPNGSGLPLVAGDVVKLQVTNVRPSVGDFEGRIQVIEV
jgi:hypothetical protein